MDSKFCGSKIIVFVNLKIQKKNPLICTTDIELAISILVKKLKSTIIYILELEKLFVVLKPNDIMENIFGINLFLNWQNYFRFLALYIWQLPNWYSCDLCSLCFLNKMLKIVILYLFINLAQAKKPNIIVIVADDLVSITSQLVSANMVLVSRNFCRDGMMWVFTDQIKYQHQILMPWLTQESSYKTITSIQFALRVGQPWWPDYIQFIQVCEKKIILKIIIV